MIRSHAKALGLFALKFTGTVVFLWWALSQMEEKQSLIMNFQLALRSPYWVVAGIGLAFISLFAGALRWFVLLRAQSIHEPFIYILRLTFYGGFFNIASLGGAAGDAAKIVLLCRRVPEKKVGIAMSVMVDHIVGFVSGGAIFLTATWGFGLMDRVGEGAAKAAFLAATWFQIGGIICVMLSLFSCTPPMLAVSRRHFPAITQNRWVSAITIVLDLYRTGWKHVIVSLFASLILSICFYLTFYAGIRSLDQQVGAVTVLSVVPIVDVLTALPISISGIGVRERSFDFLIGKLTDIRTNTAVAASLIGFLFTLFWSLVGGLMFVLARPSANLPK